MRTCDSVPVKGEKIPVVWMGAGTNEFGTDLDCAAEGPAWASGPFAIAKKPSLVFCALWFEVDQAEAHERASTIPGDRSLQPQQHVSAEAKHSIL